MFDEEILNLYYDQGWSIGRIITKFTMSEAYIARLVNKHRGRPRNPTDYSIPYLHYQFVAVGTKLQIRRLEEGLTVERAAHLFGTSVRMLNAFEAGDRDMPLSFLFRVADHYGLSLRDLLDA